MPTLSRRRVELVHESLLTHWPRLVRWRAQDFEGAQLRDELRQAAGVWDLHGRSKDYLWTGRAFREYQLWRERYPGRLTAIEEEFSIAMTRTAGRRRRHITAAVTSTFVALVVIIAIIGHYWHESNVAREQSRLEADRATAAKLLALGNAALDDDRTAALAYVTESLRLSDTPEARRFAVAVLWDGPTALVTPPGPAIGWQFEFSPDGTLLGAGYWSGDLRIYPADGGEAFAPEGFDRGVSFLEFPRNGSLAVATSISSDEIHVLEKPDWNRIRTIRLGEGRAIIGGGVESTGALVTFEAEELRGATLQAIIRRWPPVGAPELIGSIETGTAVSFDPDTGRAVFGVGHEVVVHSIDQPDEPPLVLGTHRSLFKINNRPAIDEQKRFVAAVDESGDVALWPPSTTGPRLRTFNTPPGPGTLNTVLSRDGTLLCVARGNDALLWDLTRSADPTRLPEPTNHQVSGCALHPDNTWAATIRGERVALWRLHEKRRRLLRGHDVAAGRLTFSPDSRHLYTLGSQDGRVIRWPLEGRFDEGQTVVDEQPTSWGWGIAVDPAHQFVIATTRDATRVIPLDGRSATTLEGVTASIPGAAIDPSGKMIAVSHFFNGVTSTLTLIDLRTLERREIGSADAGLVNGWGFDERGHLVIARGGTLQTFDPSSNHLETIVEKGARGLALSADGRLALTMIDARAHLVNLETRMLTPVRWDATMGENIRPSPHVISNDGMIADYMPDGAVRVGRFDALEPHILARPETALGDVAISPDGKWVAASASQGAYLWPVPDLAEPPLHTLPHGELLEKLESLTNVRAVTDPDSSNGYRIDIDDAAYHGWREVPEW